jgi:hypothetical protein
LRDLYLSIGVSTALRNLRYPALAKAAVGFKEDCDYPWDDIV